MLLVTYSGPELPPSEIVTMRFSLKPLNSPQVVLRTMPVSAFDTSQSRQSMVYRLSDVISKARKTRT